MNLKQTMSVLVITPTYNERENLTVLVPAVLDSVDGVHILVVDDNSPDGSGQLLDEMACRDRRIHVLHRAEKCGLGRAYVDGMLWGLARKYDKIVMMDADLSHDPKYLPELIGKSAVSDVVIGSRYVAGGGTKNWGLHRRLLSMGANWYIKTALGMTIFDMTSGYRCWNRRALEAIDLPSIRSNGYSFIVETLYRARLRGYSTSEIPIVFVDRIHGSSKMDWKVILESMVMVWKLLLNERRSKSGQCL